MDKWLAAGVAGLFALSASAASAATTSCSTVAACVFGSNTSSGIGVEGSSKSGSGISGVSTSGHGVNGTSSSSFGVVGITTENATSTSNARAGVYGEDSSTNGNQYNSGVAGTSKGAYGVSGNGRIGVFGSGSGSGGLGGYFHGTDGGIYLYNNDGISFSAYSYSQDTVMSLQSISAGVNLIAGYNEEEQVVAIDASGNETLRGSLTTNGTPKVRTHTSTGVDVASYGARTAAPSLEDVGKGQLRNGAAYVPLDRTFASTIDVRAAYAVFVTPEGDSNGLYTAQISPNGFAVRENKGGRSSVVFDYRIVAKPLDSQAMHLPMMSSFRQLANHAPAPRLKP